MRGRTIVALALLASGCAGAVAAPVGTESTTSTTVPTELRDLRLADDRGQIVDVIEGKLLGPSPGLLGMDGETVVGTKGNHVFWLDPAGRSRDVRVEGPPGHRIAGGVLVPLVTDTAGRWVALGPSDGHVLPGRIAPGRTTTELVLVKSAAQVVTVELDGNFVPEAFSLERSNGMVPSLFVLEYLPAQAPTHYRVQLLDPNTGDLSFPASLRRYGQTVDTEMAGISRSQVVAGQRSLLFTLYRGTHGETDQAYAFIHVLSMWGGVWCLSVPWQLDLANVQGVVAVSPDESTLYAVSGNGHIAEYSIDDVLDPARTPVARRVVRPANWVDEPPVAVVTDEHLVVGQGRTVTWFDRTDLTPAGQAAGPFFPPDALAVSGDGDVIVAVNGTLGIAEPNAPIEPLLTLPEGTGRVTRMVPG